MPVVSNSIQMRIRPSDGEDAIIYQIIPDRSVLPEGSDGTGFHILKTEGQNSRALTFEEAAADGITVEGRDFAAGYVDWNDSDQQLYVPYGMVYGRIYTLVAIKDYKVVATVTIGVTAKGDQGDQGDKGDTGDKGDKGDKGDPGIGLEIKGEAIAYFENYMDYRNADKEPGLYLVYGKQDGVRPVSIAGAYIYEYTEAGATYIYESTKGDTYRCREDGHLYMSASERLNPTSVTETFWQNCGNITGKDAVVYALNVPSVIITGNTGFLINITKTVASTTTTISYAQAVSEGITVRGSEVVISRGIASFVPPQGGVQKDHVYTIDLMQGGYVVRTYTIACIGSGEQGYEGVIIRRTEWQEGVYYRDDRAEGSADPRDGKRYLDEVSVTDFASKTTRWFIAKPAHNGLISSIAGGVVTPTAEQTSNDYWQELQKFDPLRTPFADIMNAFVQYLQVQQIVITDADGNPYGAFGAATETNPYPLWFGATEASKATVRYDLHGNVYLGDPADPAFQVVDGACTVRGSITATSGKIGGWTIGENSISSDELDAKIEVKSDNASVLINDSDVSAYAMIDVYVGMSSESVWGKQLGIYSSAENDKTAISASSVGTRMTGNGYTAIMANGASLTTNRLDNGTDGFAIVTNGFTVGQRKPIKVTSADFTLSANYDYDYIIFTAKDHTLTLPLPAEAWIGKELIVRSRGNVNYKVRVGTDSNVKKLYRNSDSTPSYESSNSRGTIYICDGEYWYENYFNA